MKTEDLELGYSRASFAGRTPSVALFRDRVLPLLRELPAKRVLDLGCGTGDLALALAIDLPAVEIVGLDISLPSIEAARQRLAGTPGQTRIEFVAADFLAWDGGKFDAILADSVLQLIPGDDSVLFEKLAQHLTARGRVFATMPTVGVQNALLVTLRHLWRLMPLSFDRIALYIARRMHKNETEAVLRDRIGYLRVTPHRLLSARLAEVAEMAGLRLSESEPWSSPSMLKLKHRFAIFDRA